MIIDGRSVYKITTILIRFAQVLVIYWIIISESYPGFFFIVLILLFVQQAVTHTNIFDEINKHDIYYSFIVY